MCGQEEIDAGNELRTNERSETEGGHGWQSVKEQVIEICIETFLELHFDRGQGLRGTTKHSLTGIVSIGGQRRRCRLRATQHEETGWWFREVDLAN